MVRKGSGNLAAAIGLYKSGQDIEKLAIVKRITDTLSRELKLGALSCPPSPDRLPLGDLSPAHTPSRLSLSKMSAGGMSPPISPTRLQR